MKLRTFMRTTACVITAMTVFMRSALGQEAPQCSLDQISQALNSLECSVAGTFISADSLAKNISDVCTLTTDADLCHVCFRKNGGNLGPALKTLVKLKLLEKSQASAFRVAWTTAEKTICGAKKASIKKS